MSLLLSIVGGEPSVSGDTWEAGAGFAVGGFIPGGGTAWGNNSVITLSIGGATGTDGARATSQTADRFMRFVAPDEYWLTRDDIIDVGAGVHGNQTPFLMRFVGETGGAAAPYSWSQAPGKGEAIADHPGPMFPLADTDFLYPYVVLGGLANTELPLADSGAVTRAAIPSGDFEVELAIAVNFDLDSSTPGSNWYNTNVDDLSTDGIANLLLHGKRNLYDLLTKGSDPSGKSSELFITMKDATNAANNGCFRVIGLGPSATPGTTRPPTTASSSSVWLHQCATVGATVEVEFRTQYMNTEDNPGNAYPAIAICLTDLEGLTGGMKNPGRWPSQRADGAGHQPALRTLPWSDGAGG